MTANNTYAGNLYLVSGLANGREIFLGKAIDEPFQELLTLKGKSISFSPHGTLVVRPFETLVNFPLNDPRHPSQQITDTEAIAEATSVLSTATIQIHRSSYPLLSRWIESGIQVEAVNRNGINGNRRAIPTLNPLFSFNEGFRSSAEQFRRALFLSPQITSAVEMDQLTELEGDLTIEIGKLSNQIAIKLNQIFGREQQLAHYLDTIECAHPVLAMNHNLGGWMHLIQRMEIAKNWARRTGKTPLVREINAITKEGISGLNEIILGHCSSLDTLITETFSQYGITYEIHGLLSPFTSYTTPMAAPIESYETAAAVATTAMFSPSV